MATSLGGLSLTAERGVDWSNDSVGGTRQHDATALVRSGKRFSSTPRIDQGQGDKFLERELRPELFETACKDAGQALELHRHAGYDHSYFFIQTFVEAHLEHHARVLRPA